MLSTRKNPLPFDWALLAGISATASLVLAGNTTRDSEGPLVASWHLSLRRFPRALRAQIRFI